MRFNKMKHDLMTAFLGTSMWLCSATAALSAPETVFVEKGIPKLVREEGRAWQRGKGYIECSGVKNYLYAGKAIGAGDFHIKARLSIFNLAKSAASFVVNGTSHFGFEGATGRMFVQGTIFGGKTAFLGKPVVKAGTPFLFEVIRKGSAVAFLIDGKLAHKITFTGERFGMIGFRPWRSKMQINEFSAVGEMRNLQPPRTQPTTYTIPTIDLSKDKQRQVIVERIPGQYLGHPTTVLLSDNKTILVVYPLGHGGPSAVLKKSTDGGLTWSERLLVPDNWKTAKNCPSIHRITGPDDVERLFVLEGNGAMRQSVSLDNGKTWTPFKPNGLHCVVAPITIVLISGGRHLALYHRGQNDRDRSPLTIWQSISSDGCLTWESERKVAAFEGADLCEPAVIRSPDGKQLAALMRENSRRYNSMLIVSSDEGETWSKPVELPASLTGDRHCPRYSHDGRLVITFRDTALGSPTRGDFAAWVGTYDDIVNLREGQYRVRLLNSPKKFDLGYAGLELLPNGTFVATTYAVLAKGEKNSVVSIRFDLKELDERAARMKCEQTDIFISGKDGYHTFRIPSIIVTPKGTILAFCEGRRRDRSDAGDIDIVLKRSTDGGVTWSAMEVIADEGANTIGNPCPVIDSDTGTIWLLLTHNLGQDREGKIWAGTSRGTRTVWVMKSTDDGVTWSKPVEITETTKEPNWSWYATGPGVGIQLKSGRLLIPCDHGVAGGKDFHSHVIYSDDHGETWKLGGSVPDKTTSECQVVELVDGSLQLNIRNHFRKTYRRAISYSKDGGLTWSEPSHDQTLITPHCQASIVRYTAQPAYAKDRILFSNPASVKGRERMTVRVSYDEGKTWPVSKVLHAGPSAYSCLTVLPDMAIGCLYECGEKHPYERITLARLSLAWMTNGVDTP